MQVPNRYYNSPWIADAARNLSLALAGDPERDNQRLLMKQREYEMQRQRDADARAAEDRAKGDQARALLGQMLTANEGDVPALLSKVLTTGGVPTADAFTAAGTASPKYRQQLGLQDAKLSGVLDALDRRLTAQEKLAEMADKTRRRGQDMSAETSRYGTDTRADTADKNRDQRTQAAKDKAAGSDKPFKISPLDASNLMLNVTQLAKSKSAQLDQPTLDAITTRATQLYQQTRNAGTAAAQAFDEFVGASPTITPGQSHIPFVHPAKPPTIVPSRPTSLGDVLQMGAPAPTGPINPGLSDALNYSLFAPPPAQAPAPPAAPRRPPLSAFQR